jgi:hypothetical protein
MNSSNPKRRSRRKPNFFRGILANVAKVALIGLSPEAHRQRRLKILEREFKDIFLEDDEAERRRLAAQERRRGWRRGIIGGAAGIGLGVLSSYLASALWDRFPLHHHGPETAQAAPIALPPKDYSATPFKRGQK